MIAETRPCVKMILWDSLYALLHSESIYVMKIQSSIVPSQIALIVICGVMNPAWSAEEYTTMPKDKRCIFIAHTYNNAISARNSGLPPENALAMADFKELPLELRKKIVNEVYFDKNLRTAVSSNDLVFELIQQCLHGSPKPHQPLK